MLNPIHRHQRQGFTLIELLAVVTLLAIIIGIAVPAVNSRLKQGKIRAAQVEIGGIEQALNAFNLDCNFFPSTEQGLEALISPPTVGKQCKNYDSDGYLKKKVVPTDPWQNPYIYVSPGQHNPSSFDLYSIGPDEQAGTDDDIKSWE